MTHSTTGSKIALIVTIALALSACAAKQASVTAEQQPASRVVNTAKVQSLPEMSFEKPSEVFAALQIPEQCPESENFCTTQLPSTPEAIAKTLGLPLTAWEKKRATTDTDPPVSYDTYSYDFTPNLYVALNEFDFGVVVNSVFTP